MSLSSAFKSASTQGFGQNIFAPSAGQDNDNANVIPKETLLASISGGQDFSVSATSMTTVQTANTQTNVAGQAANVQASAGVVKSQAQMGQAQISACIRSAQQEVIAVQKELGHGSKMIFASAPSATGDLVNGVTGGAASGISQLLDACSDMRGAKNAKEIQAQIIDELKSRSQSASSHIPMPSADKTVNQTPTADIDWNNFADQGHGLETLMNTDADNPPESICPEFKELRDLECTADKELALAAVAQEKANNDITTDPKHFIENTQNSLANINQCVIPDIAIDHEVKDIVEKCTYKPPVELQASLKQNLPGAQM